MFNLDPAKLIVIAVVAIILLGPDKLPQFARQVGGAWRTFNDFRRRMESEVRSTMPDLPPSSEIARLARSPSALLTHLSNLSGDEGAAEAEAEAEAPDGSYQPPPAAAGGAATNGAGEGSADAGGATPGVAAPGAAAVPGPGAATNGRPAVAPQPADVAVPADPTLN